jgi:hypothetical protein
MRTRPARGEAAGVLLKDGPVVRLALVVLMSGVIFVFVTGQADDLRSQLGSLGTNFNLFAQAMKPAKPVEDQRTAWAGVAAKANAICTDPTEDELTVRVAIPQNAAEFVRTLAAVRGREQVKLAALRALQPPPGYDITYTRFLRDREATLLAIDSVRQAVQKRDRTKLVRAARSILRLQASINTYVQSAGIPACRI